MLLAIDPYKNFSFGADSTDTELHKDEYIRYDLCVCVQSEGCILVVFVLIRMDI